MISLPVGAPPSQDPHHPGPLLPTPSTPSPGEEGEKQERTTRTARTKRTRETSKTAPTGFPSPGEGGWSGRERGRVRVLGGGSLFSRCGGVGGVGRRGPG